MTLTSSHRSSRPSPVVSDLSCSVAAVQLSGVCEKYEQYKLVDNGYHGKQSFMQLNSLWTGMGYTC